MTRHDSDTAALVDLQGSAAALDAVLHAHPAAHQALADALAANPDYAAWLRQIHSDVPAIIERPAES